MMGFWIFMTCCNLLIPLTMIGLGYHFKKTAPKEINFLFGYRTEMSMKNKNTWEFAHHYIGHLWFKSGIILMVIVFAAMLCLIHQDTNTVGLAGGLIVMIQLIPLIAPIFPTEAALKKQFDKDGNRR